MVEGLLQPRYTLLVEGESGSGKSLFLRELIKEAQKKRKVLCFSNISTGAAPTSTSLGAFIRVMQRIFPNPRHVLDDGALGRCLMLLHCFLSFAPVQVLVTPPAALC